MTQAQALWITGAGKAECLNTTVLNVKGGLEVETLFSGISRGTERLVFQGAIPASEHRSMRAPFQEGEFGFPVKYGYAAVGRIVGSARDGEYIFSLHPHQTRFVVPPEAAVTIPCSVPAERAVLAANMETALNITWDAGVKPGDKVAVIGAGVVGSLAGYLSARIPGTDVRLVDIAPGKARLAKALGCGFAQADEVDDDHDVVIHASASSSGLSTAIGAAGMEAKIVEASWFGDRVSEVPLGGAFHQKRLQLISSQVGRIPAQQSARWSFRRRLSKALDLLSDPALDILVSGETVFEDLPEAYEAILNDPETLCHRVRYDAGRT